MTDSVLVRRTRRGGADDVQLEDGVRHFASAVTYVAFDVFNPDPVKVLVAEHLQDGIHMLVEFLDSVFLDLLFLRSKVLDFGFDLVASCLNLVWPVSITKPHL